MAEDKTGKGDAPRMTYRDAQILRFNNRAARFKRLLEIKAPATVLAKEGGMIIRAVIGIVGGGALAEVADTLIGYEKNLNGLCSLHDDDDNHPIADKDSRLCAECLADAAVMDADSP